MTTYRLTPTTSSALKRFASCLSVQAKRNKGLTLVVGETGTGKTEMITHFAQQTKRVLLGTRGAEWSFSDANAMRAFEVWLTKAVTTPGAVVLLDEVFYLHPEGLSILRHFGDRRVVPTREGRWTKIAEGALVVLAGNPRTEGPLKAYGTNILGLTSGQSMVMPNPALRRGDLVARDEYWSDSKLLESQKSDPSLLEWVCDEALIVKDFFPPYDRMTDGDFAELWETHLNRGLTLRTPSVRSPEARDPNSVKSGPATASERDLRLILDVLCILNKWRRNLENKTPSPSFWPGYRDSIALVTRLAKLKDVRNAFNHVYVASGAEQVSKIMELVRLQLTTSDEATSE